MVRVVSFTGRDSVVTVRNEQAHEWYSDFEKDELVYEELVSLLEEEQPKPTRIPLTIGYAVKTIY